MSTLEIIAQLKKNKVFPSLVGDQLKLTGETKNLPDELIALIKQRKEELCAFLRDSMDQLAFVPILPVEKMESYPASNAQRRLWVMCQFDGGAAAYNIVRSLYLKGTVVREHLDKAFNLSIQRHESLRTVLKEIEGELRQFVLDSMPFAIEYEDISGQDDIKSYLESAVERSANWQFDLENGPLLKVRLIRLSDKEHAMIFGLHHIISDGWSISVMVQEVMRSYEALCKNEAHLMEPLAIHYKDYTQWLTQKTAGDKGQSAKDFWQSQFASTFDPLDLPADFLRPEIKAYEGAIAKFYFEDDFYADILEYCKTNHITLFNFFRAALSILLSRFSGQDDITIGTPVSGRNHFYLENQIGLYVNTLPLRININPDCSFADFLKTVSDHSFKAFEYQDYPLDKIIENLDLKRDISRNPLFDVMLVLQNTAMGDGGDNINKQYGFELGLLDNFLYPSARKEDQQFASKFDLNFNFDKDPDGRFYLEIEYATRLFKKARINQFFKAFIHIVSQVIAAPEIMLDSITIVDEHEKHKILHAFNAPVGTITEHSIIDLLNGSFLNRGKDPAIITQDKTVSYQELNDYAAAVAAYLYPLTAEKHTPFVGLMLDRSEWIIITILGILKAGAAYVPVDTRYPASRISYILEDAGLEFIIVDDTGRALIPDNYKGVIIHINEFKTLGSTVINNAAPSKDLREHTAYLIYTSGSTGAPKGVEICHRNTIAFLKWAEKEFAGTAFEILYATTSYCFDLSIFECFFPLMQGKTIRILQSALEITAYVTTDKQIMINTVPAVVRNLLDQGMDWLNVTALNMAGEPVPKKIKQDLDFSGMEVRNLYGPSEDTTYSTVYRFEQDDYPVIPIGVPVGYTQLYIMDKYGHLLPEGVNGEIYLSGQSVAKGYFNKAVLTAEKFMDNPFIPGIAMYRTGDIGKWLPDGKVEFAGRIDDQAKVRGYRVEPGEIQFLLEQHPQVEQAVVTVASIDSENRIAAYWLGDESITAALLKDYLSRLLPAYMVPDYLVKLETIPLNSNGKVDKKKLPDPVTVLDQTLAIVPPKNKLEQQLLELWKEVLQVGELGVTHNFFDAGGHSLKATKLRTLIAASLGKHLTLNEIFTCSTIEKQAEILAVRAETAIIPIQQAAAAAHYPIALTQERLWVLTKFEEASKAYNMPAAFRINGNLDVKKLEYAFRQVIEKYEILRTVFTGKEKEPVQIVLPPSDVNFSIEEITIAGTLSPQATTAFLQEKWQVAFDLEKGPLLACFILTTDNDRLLSFNMHHIISDGWSIVVLYKNVIAAYRNLVSDSIEQLPLPELQYKDYAVWQRSPQQTAQLAGQGAFWKAQFNDEIPVLELPVDFYRPAVKTYNGETFAFQFEPALAQQINQLARQSGASLFIMLMAGVSVLLKKYANQHDLVIGTPVAGRNYHQLQDQIGFFVNTLAIRTKIDGAIAFRSLLEQQKKDIWNALEFQDYPFEMLLDELSLKRDMARSPLFDVMVVLQNLEELNSDDMRQITPGLTFDRVQVPSGIAKYDLTFSFGEDKNSLLLELEYNTSLFKEDTIERMVRHLVKLFEEVTANPEIAVKDIMLLDKDEYDILLSKADQTHVSYNKSATIVSLFQQAVNSFPDNIALVAGDKQLTYRELNERSGQLACMLMKEHGVSEEDLVILHCDRSEWMIISILAVLKAGAAYVPVDPTYPAARIDYIIEDSRSRLILYDISPDLRTRNKWADNRFLDIVNLDYTGRVAVAAVQPGNLAYVIYTSGTTGNPKGVQIEHGNVTRLLFNEHNRFDFNSNDRWSLFHSYCFDFSVWEMYGALLNGGMLVMVPKEVAQNSIAFYDFLIKEGITVLNQTPTAFRSLIQNNRQRFLHPPVTIRYLIFGGEALMPETLREWHAALPGCKNINMYGITETTVHVTYKEITSQEINENKSNIGLPIPTLSCYVLDSDLQQVPVGVIGELCVGGAGVARGYLNKPELTALKFIWNPVRSGERIYRSGDYARILPSGDIEYIGRKDDQVKIRGHRIEIGEIEAVLSNLEGIQDVIVVPVKNSNDEYDLLAYFIPEEGLDDRDIRAELTNLLPAYMVPSYLIPLPAFPLNENGKLDRKALPGPEDIAVKHAIYVAARNEMDKEIIAIWEAVLDKKDLGIKDNFFDLGGNSLKATRVISKMHETFGVKIDLKNLFVDPTIEHLSDYVETIQWMETKNDALVADGNEIIL